MIPRSSKICNFSWGLSGKEAEANPKRRKWCNRDYTDHLIAESVLMFAAERSSHFSGFKSNWKLVPVDLPLSMCWFSLCASYCSLLTYLSFGNLFVIFLWHSRQMHFNLKSDRCVIEERGANTLFWGVSSGNLDLTLENSFSSTLLLHLFL